MVATTDTRSRTLDRYQGVAASIPDEWVLGDLLSFTISEADILHSDAVRSLEALNLPLTHMKTRIRPVDAFSKATKDLEKRFPKHKSGIQSRFIVPPGDYDDHAKYRWVVLERLKVEKGKRRRLVYSTVADMTFHRGETDDDGNYTGFSVDVTRRNVPDLELSDQEEAWLDSMLGNLPGRFEHYRTHLDSHAVRRYVVQTIEDLSGLSVKDTGGFYFVPQRHLETVGKLKEWVESIGSKFHTIPLVDLEDQRDMLMDAYEAETVGQIERMMADISDILADDSRTIKQATHDQLLQTASELLNRTREYQDLLDRNLDTARTQAEIFRRQVVELAVRVQ